MSLFELAWHFFILSLVAFGAATSVVPDLHRVFVETTHLMSENDFAGLFAMSQAAPGTNVMFVPVIGWRVAGILGAIVALVAFCSPTAVLALGIERLGKRYRAARWHVTIRRALAPITVGLLISTGYLLGQTTMTPVGITLLLVAAGVLTWTKLTPLWVTAAGAIVGAAGFV